MKNTADIYYSQTHDCSQHSAVTYLRQFHLKLQSHEKRQKSFHSFFILIFFFPLFKNVNHLVEGWNQSWNDAAFCQIGSMAQSQLWTIYHAHCQLCALLECSQVQSLRLHWSHCHYSSSKCDRCGFWPQYECPFSPNKLNKCVLFPSPSYKTNLK